MSSNTEEHINRSCPICHDKQLAESPHSLYWYLSQDLVLVDGATTHPHTSPYLAWQSRSKAFTPYKALFSKNVNHIKCLGEAMSAWQVTTPVFMCLPYLSEVEQCAKKRPWSWSRHSQLFEKPKWPNTVPILQNNIEKQRQLQPTCYTSKINMDRTVNELQNSFKCFRNRCRKYSQQQQGEKDSQQSPSGCWKQHFDFALRERERDRAGHKPGCTKNEELRQGSKWP